jgi:hypothetical protein
MAAETSLGIVVNPQTGWIKEVLICALDDQQGAVVQGALARLIKTSHWGWLQRLIGKMA